MKFSISTIWKTIGYYVVSLLRNLLFYFRFTHHHYPMFDFDSDGFSTYEVIHMKT